MPNTLAISAASRVPHVGVGRFGITLPEVLTAALVLSVIMGTVTSIYTGSLRAWCRGSAETYAEQKAAWAVQRMVPDIRSGISVLPGVAPHEASYITIQLPHRVFDTGQNTYLNQIAVDAHGNPYLVPGGWAVYFRGDAAGNADAGGDRIWRRLVAADGSVLKEDVLADHVVDNPDDATGNPHPMFVYWPDVYRLRSVEVTVTVQEKQGSRTGQTTMNGEITLRNR